jgi:hypothetical protein
MYWACLVVGILLVAHFGNGVDWANSGAEAVIGATLVLLIKV